MLRWRMEFEGENGSFGSGLRPSAQDDRDKIGLLDFACHSEQAVGASKNPYFLKRRTETAAFPGLLLCIFGIDKCPWCVV